VDNEVVNDQKKPLRKEFVRTFAINAAKGAGVVMGSLAGLVVMSAICGNKTNKTPEVIAE
jgi:hypothetical protein